MNFKIYVVAEIVSICLLVWFGIGLLRIATTEEEPVISNTINFANADSGNQNSFLTVDVAQNDKFVKFQVTQGNPVATLCPQGDSVVTDCAQTDHGALDLSGIDTTGSVVWKVQPGVYTLGISDNQNELVSYNLFVIHQPGINAIARLSLSALVCGVASIVIGWVILKEIKKRKLREL
jgi:hypothetical protein